MIHLEELDGGFRAVDAAKNEVTVEIDDWEPGGEELEIGYEVDETITGSGTEIRLPHAGFVVESSELDDPRMINMNERIRLKNGSHFFRLGTDITVYIRTMDSGSMFAENFGNYILIGFPTPMTFTIGFCELSNDSREILRIPPSVEGAALAISTCAAMHTTETPDRAFPSERPSIPHLILDENVEVTENDLSQSKNPIRFRVPKSLRYLFPIGSIAFYLGADVILDDTSIPVLELGSDCREFSRGSMFEEEIAKLLRRIFYLDCLVREVGPRRLGIQEFRLLEQTTLKPERLYHSPVLYRVKEYLEEPFEPISSELPDWPLATFVEPTLDHLPAISYLIKRLSLVFSPRASPIDGNTLVERSLGDFYRSTDIGPSPEQPLEISSLGGLETQVKGWIAGGAPIDGFKCIPEAIENQRHYISSTSEPISISVICNDETMAVEQSEVVDIYQKRAIDLDIKLNMIIDATTTEVASTFESQTDFVHYIGHCDPEGFRCTNGNISARELSRCRARTFFLNACGSYSEGIELVRSGGVAGAVTFGDVIDAQAAKVGVNFARLFMLGYTIQRSLHHASGLAIVNKQYTTVGDGTHVLTQGDSIQPSVMEVKSTSNGFYEVTVDMAPVNLAGSVVLPYSSSEPNLMGNRVVTQINRSRLKDLVDKSIEPIIFNDKFYWPEELLDELF